MWPTILIPFFVFCVCVIVFVIKNVNWVYRPLLFRSLHSVSVIFSGQHQSRQTWEGRHGGKHDCAHGANRATCWKGQCSAWCKVCLPVLFCFVSLYFVVLIGNFQHVTFGLLLWIKASSDLRVPQLLFFYLAVWLETKKWRTKVLTLMRSLLENIGPRFITVYYYWWCLSLCCDGYFYWGRMRQHAISLSTLLTFWSCHENTLNCK